VRDADFSSQAGNDDAEDQGGDPSECSPCMDGGGTLRDIRPQGGTNYLCLFILQRSAQPSPLGLLFSEVPLRFLQCVMITLEDQKCCT